MSTKFKVGDRIKVAYEATVVQVPMNGSDDWYRIKSNNSDLDSLHYLYPSHYAESGSIELLHEPLPNGLGAVIDSEGFNDKLVSMGGDSGWFDTDGDWYTDEEILKAGRFTVLQEGVPL